MSLLRLKSPDLKGVTFDDENLTRLSDASEDNLIQVDNALGGTVGEENITAEIPMLQTQLLEQPIPMTASLEIEELYLENTESEESDSSISEEESSKFSADFLENVKTMEPIAPSADYGKFYDPLTGEYMDNEGGIEEEEEDEEELEEQVPEVTDESFEDDDLLIFLEKDEQELVEDMKILQQKEQEELPDPLAQMTVIKVKDDIKEEIQENLANAEYKERYEMITKFVDGLINKVVDVIDYVDPFKVSLNKMDKRKLLAALKQKLVLLDIRDRYHTLLTRKVIQHFRRNKHFGAIIETHHDTKAERDKYSEICHELNLLLYKKHEMEEMNKKTIEGLTRECDEAKAVAQQEAHNFEKLAMQIFGTNDASTKNQRIAEKLQKIADVRAHISETRLKLIQKQHVLASEQKRLEELEDLGEGITYSDYENLNIIIDDMDKKIQGFNADLGSLTFHYQTDINSSAHIQEKTLMICETIRKQEFQISLLLSRRNRIRTKLSALKFQRSQLQQSARELAISAGMMDKPILLLDYDRTLENVNSVQKRVNNLKAEYLETLKKIKLITKKLKTNQIYT